MKAKNVLRIALLHLAAVAGQVAQNRRVIETALRTAARANADWALTPELAVSGYGFLPLIGTDWISIQPDAWTLRLGLLAQKLGITIFLGAPERVQEPDALFNAVLIIDHQGTLIGRHHKIKVIPGGFESWSTPGEVIAPISIDSLQVGVLVCADAYFPEVAMQLKEKGAQILISSAAWMPGEHGPNGAWEQRSLETGLPLIVCNRTGQDSGMDFKTAESIVACDGRRLFTYQSPQPAVILVDWNLKTMRPNGTGFQVIHL